MKALIQRVKQAAVHVEGECVGAIERGVLVLLGIDKHDTEQSAEQLMDKLLAYRIFADADGKMNLSVRAVDGGVLLVSQFTLSADTRKGLRPSFSTAATPVRAQQLYEHCLAYIKQQHGQQGQIVSGRFAADMQVSLVNDGPVTFLLEN